MNKENYGLLYIQVEQNKFGFGVSLKQLVGYWSHLKKIIVEENALDV